MREECADEAVVVLDAAVRGPGPAGMRWYAGPSPTRHAASRFGSRSAHRGAVHGARGRFQRYRQPGRELALPPLAVTGGNARGRLDVRRRRLDVPWTVHLEGAAAARRSLRLGAARLDLVFLGRSSVWRPVAGDPSGG